MRDSCLNKSGEAEITKEFVLSSGVMVPATNSLGKPARTSPAFRQAGLALAFLR